jgi:hypothetical protein
MEDMDSVPFLDIKILLLIPMPMIRRNQIILLNRDVFPLCSILDHLDLQYGTSFGWEDYRQVSVFLIRIFITLFLSNSIYFKTLK